MKTLEVTVLSNNKELQTNLEKENITDLVIHDLKTKYSGLEIKGLDDVAGYKAVDEARKEVKRIRVMAEKIVKAETDKAFQAHKSAVADGKKVIARFTDIEVALDQKQTVIDTLKAEILLKAEQEKKAKNEQRVKDLQKYNYQGDLMVIEFLSDEQFEERLLMAKHHFEAAEKIRFDEIAALEKQRKEQDAREKELQLQEKERIEAAAKIKAEQDAKEKEIADREKKLQEAEEKVEREKKEAADKIIRDAEIKEAEEKAAAKAIADAELKRIADAKALEEKQAKEKAEAERLEALKPDKEKLATWVNSCYFTGVIYPEEMSATAEQTCNTIAQKFIAFKEWAQKEVDSLS